jgi:hypothetical protein
VGHAAELSRQVETLLAKGYPRLAGLDEPRFLDLIDPLRNELDDLPPSPEPGRIPFVLVATSQLVSTEQPSGAVYLLLDVDSGANTLNVTPDDALPRIAAAGRSPLTIDEAVAVVTHYPEVLRTKNCFSILGSRCGDRRVPAMWVSRGHPRLGWCWAGNPHTWLGSASCGGRVGAGRRAGAVAGAVA